MKPFDLEKALAGESVITIDGIRVTGLTKFEGLDSSFVIFPVYGVIDGKVENFTTDGKYYDRSEPHEKDLFMEVSVRWINLYGNRVDGHYESRKDADANARPDRISCITINYEDG